MNLQIYDEASEWVVKHRDGGLDAREKKVFDAWLRESPHHVRAYLEMSSVWEDVPLLEPSRNPSAEELIARAQGADNVVPLSASSTPARMAGDAAPRNRKGRLIYAVAASLVIAVAGGWVYLQRGIYATGIGEQRSLSLADGSSIDLNSDSRVNVRFTGRERRVDLIEGQALFHVTKSSSRPFVVFADKTEVRALGTAFDIYEARSGTVVTVVEGKVAVSPRAVPLPSDEAEIGNDVVLSAGEQVRVTHAVMTASRRANVAAVTAWTRRSLVFESSLLTEVAQEFNRYNTRRLVIEDPQLADFHISGVFSSVEPSLLLRFLRAQPELSVEETDTEIRVKKK